MNRNLVRVRGVGHDLLNAAELRLLEEMGGRVHVEGHHLGAYRGDRSLVFIEIGLPEQAIGIGGMRIQLAPLDKASNQALILRPINRRRAARNSS